MARRFGLFEAFSLQADRYPRGAQAIGKPQAEFIVTFEIDFCKALWTRDRVEEGSKEG